MTKDVTASVVRMRASRCFGAAARFAVLVVAALTMQLRAMTALAQQPAPGQGTAAAVTQPPPAATAPVFPPLYSVPFGTEHLFGDWAGALPWLQDRGINLGLDFFSETAGIVSGGLKHGVTNTSQVGLSIDLDGEKLFDLPGFAIHNVIVERNGRSASADFLHDDLDAVQQIFGDGGDVIAHLVYLYGEQALWNGRVDIAAGWLPVGNYFASSPIYCSFMNVIYCGNPHPLPVYAAEPDWPNATIGGQVRVFALPSIYVMAGLFQVRPDFGGPSGWAMFEHASTGLSVPVEFGWVPHFGPDGLVGHYKFGFDEDSSTYPDLYVGSNGQPIALTGQAGQPHEGRRMYYVLVDQMLMRTGKSDTDGLIAFGGWVHADRDVSPLENQVFGGVLSTAAFLGRPQDSLGFAASWFEVSGALTATQQLEETLGLPLSGGGLGTPTGVQGHEMTLEAMYTAAVYRGVALMPDIQYVIRPGGTSRTRNAVALGLQTNIAF